MSHIAIEKVAGENAESAILEDLKALSETIRERAVERFKRRGGGDGMAIEDWIKAERELLLLPEFELIEKDSRFEVNIKDPDYKLSDVEVTAFPNALIVKAQVNGFRQKILFRRFELPGPVNIDTVTANLDGGVLRLAACRATGQAAPKQRGDGGLKRRRHY